MLKSCTNFLKFEMTILHVSPRDGKDSNDDNSLDNNDDNSLKSIVENVYKREEKDNSTLKIQNLNLLKRRKTMKAYV